MSKNLQLSDNVNYISPKMFKQILDYVDKEFNKKSKNKKGKDIIVNRVKIPNEHIKMIFKISYYSGLRVNEVLKLNTNSFNFDINEINLGKTKTEQRGRASIPESFKEELFDFIQNSHTPYSLFPITRQTAYEWIMKIGKALKINAWTTPQTETNEKTKTHIFRKSVAKDMLYRGAPLNIVQRKLRHSNINTTSEYLKIKLNDVKNWENENL